MSETCQQQLWLKFKLKTVTINKSENIGRGEQPEERCRFHLLYVIGLTATYPNGSEVALRYSAGLTHASLLALLSVLLLYLQLFLFFDSNWLAKLKYLWCRCLSLFYNNGCRIMIKNAVE